MGTLFELDLLLAGALVWCARICVQQHEFHITRYRSITCTQREPILGVILCTRNWPAHDTFFLDLSTEVAMRVQLLSDLHNEFQRMHDNWVANVVRTFRSRLDRRLERSQRGAIDGAL